MKIIISFLPVLIFLLLLIYFDSFKLIKKQIIIACLLWGMLSACFAIIENIFYLDSLTSNNILLWIVRGFGTAIMHGGTISIMAIIVMNSINRKKIFLE